MLTCEEDLSTADGFPRPGSGALHQRPLLRQQQVILSFIDQVSETTEKQVYDIYIAQYKMLREMLLLSVFVVSNLEKINRKILSDNLKGSTKLWDPDQQNFPTKHTH